MSKDRDEFWSALPDRAWHPLRIPVIEALWWTGEPLSPIDVVDVLEGDVTMWEATHHLRILASLGITRSEPGDGERGEFDVLYRLTYFDR